MSAEKTLDEDKVQLGREISESDKIELAVVLFDQKKMTLVEFTQFLTGVKAAPGWLIALCKKTQTFMGKPGITFKIGDTSEIIKYIKLGLQRMLAYKYDYKLVDNTTNNVYYSNINGGIKNAKEYFNSEYVKQFKADTVVDYDFLSTLIMAYVKEYLIRSEKMNYNVWFNGLRDWVNELGSSTYEFKVSKTLQVRKIRYLQIALAHLGYHSFEWYGTQNQATYDAVLDFKTKYTSKKTKYDGHIDQEMLNVLLEKVYDVALIEDKYIQLCMDLTGGLSWPTYLKTINSYFGYRYYSAKRKFHDGIDSPVSLGTEVKATANGTAIAKLMRGYGNVTDIIHGYKNNMAVVTRNAHLRECILEGNVKKGDAVAKSGNSGGDYAAHLHFEVIVCAAHMGSPSFNEVLFRLDPDIFLPNATYSVTISNGR